MRLAAYLRVSTDRQAEEGHGLDVQEQAVRAWARRHDHRVTVVLRDEGVAGSNAIEARRALPEVLELVQRHEVDGVIVANLDRLARKLTVQEAILGRLWDAGGRVYTADEGEVVEDDPDDPMRTAMRQMRGVFHQLDRAMIAKRLRDGRRVKAATGGYAYGSPAFGLRAEDKTLVVDELEAAAVQRIRQLAGDGESLRAIARTLEAEGVPPKRGQRWHPQTVARVLRHHAGTAASRQARSER